MSMFVRRAAASLFFSFRHPFFQQSLKRLSLSLLALLSVLALAPSAEAVIVRGTVTDPLGAVVIGARVQLVQGKAVVAFALTGDDGP